MPTRLSWDEYRVESAKLAVENILRKIAKPTILFLLFALSLRSEHIVNRFSCAVKQAFPTFDFFGCSWD
jgi:hypothetical protein